jgi:hypothetical protein
LNGLKEYGYSGIDGSSKVRILMRGIKTTGMDFCKANIYSYGGAALGIYQAYEG